MTPKETAKELVDKMWNIDEGYGSIGFHEAKQCALIAVDEISEAVIGLSGVPYDVYEYWEQVKEELEKL